MTLRETGLGTIDIGKALRRYTVRGDWWVGGIVSACVSWAKSQFFDGVPNVVLKQDGSLSFTWRTPSEARRVGVIINGESSSSCNLLAVVDGLVFRVSGMAEAEAQAQCTTPLIPSLNTANVKARRWRSPAQAQGSKAIIYVVCRLRMVKKRPIPGPSPFA